MQASEVALDLIKKYEFGGLEVPLKAYWDKYGRVWTIGWGHTIGVYKDLTITLEEAVNFLREDINWAVKAVNELVSVPVSQSMFDALVSFTFNVGRGALKASTLLKLLNGFDVEGAANEFTKWTYAGSPKIKLTGLVKRREAEKSLFLKGWCNDKEVAECLGQN
jgi:lysozyme